MYVKIKYRLLSNINITFDIGQYMSYYTVHFCISQSNASFQNRNIKFLKIFKKNLTDAKLLNGNMYVCINLI